MELTTRRKNIISGLIALVLVIGSTTIGIKFSFGAFDSGYTLFAEFDAAGQGLINQSDVKIRGVNIGHVDSIRLHDGRALVTLFINSGHDIPESATATIRPKTLFGEKFVDIQPGDDEVDGPFLADGEAIEHTEGGFELERVLADAFPLLQHIDPHELFIVLDTLASAGDGLGEEINRTIVNNDAILEVQNRHDADTRQFLEDLAAFSDELAGRADDLVAGARDLNVALPVLTENADAFAALLEQTARVSDDLSDILLANQAFIDANYGPGQRVLDVLTSRQDQIVPLVIGLRLYLQTIAEAIRIGNPGLTDGSLMAAVKGLLGGAVCEDDPSGVVIGFCDGVGSTAAGSAANAPPPTVTVPTGPGLLDGLTGALTGEVSTGAQAISDLMVGLLGRASP